MSMRDAFEARHRQIGWLSGSEPEHIGPYCRFLEGYIRSRGVRSVLDLGCGPGLTRKYVDLTGVEYTGIDCVDFGFNLIADVLTCPLPAADLVVMKDVLQHWPNRQVNEMYLRLRDYPRVLLTNSAAGVNTNGEIETGGFRSLDLTKVPFAWPVHPVFMWIGDETKVTVELEARP